MPRYSAPGAIRRYPTAAPVHRTGANLSPANMCCPPAPAGNRRAPSCASRVVTPEAGKAEIADFAGHGPAAGLFHAAANGAGLQRTDLYSVPVPRIEET